jgi:hypothetical protein
MKNKEKFAKKIIEVACSGEILAKHDDKLYKCSEISCVSCDFKSEAGKDCAYWTRKWAESEYVEYETDWAKVPVDTPVLLKDKDNVDNKRHFYKTLSEGALALFINGRTSWSSIAEAGVIKYCSHSKSNVTLAREKDKLKYRKQVK